MAVQIPDEEFLGPSGWGLCQIMGQDAEVTDLDRAQLAADTGSDAARLAFFRVLADTPLYVLLERESVDGVLEPRIFDLEAGQVVLAFDREERLATMGDGPLPYAELPGRVLARLLASEGLALGLNLGAGSASEMLLPVTAMTWLLDMLDQSPNMQIEGFGEVGEPDPGLVELVRSILTNAPSSWAGLADGLRLFSRGSDGLILVEGAAPESEIALATALSEALRFSGVQGMVVDIGFADGRTVPAGGMALSWPKPAMEASAQAEPTAPGMDPSKPPKLRKQ